VSKAAENLGSAIQEMKEALREEFVREQGDVKAKARALVAEYKARDAKRDAELDELRDEDGEPRDGDYAKLDERRYDLALEAADDLGGLIRNLEELLA
jgi:Sec-independent protein translocase protein TatA